MPQPHSYQKHTETMDHSCTNKHYSYHSSSRSLLGFRTGRWRHYLLKNTTQIKVKSKMTIQAVWKIHIDKRDGCLVWRNDYAQDNWPAARGFLSIMSSMPTMSGRSPNNRVSMTRQKFVPAKAIGASTIPIVVSFRCGKRSRVVVGPVMKERLAFGWVR